MGDDHGQPGTFEEAVAATFGERASEFSEQLRGSLRVLYNRGRRDGRRAEGQPATCHVLKARRWEGTETERYAFDLARMMTAEEDLER